MLVSNGADYKLYKSRLEEIKPFLNQLASGGNTTDKRKIFWLNQFPTVDFWGPIHGNNDDIYADKIHQYNSILKNVLRYACTRKMCENSIRHNCLCFLGTAE